MARTIKQFRYYGENNSKNQPSAANPGGYISGKVFKENGLISIVQLGIQALPGTQFYINNAIEPIIIGSTGIYELDLRGLTEITDLSFSTETMNKIDNSGGAYLIVDAIYEVEED